MNDQPDFSDPKYDKLDLRKLFLDSHQYADTDVERSSIHHTLGPSATQAAPGNHNHKYGNLVEATLTPTSGFAVKETVHLYYSQMGFVVNWWATFTLNGSNTQQFMFRCPVPPATYETASQYAGNWWGVRQGIGYRHGMWLHTNSGPSGVAGDLTGHIGDGSANVLTGVLPVAWQIGDVFVSSGTYIAASEAYT